MDVIDVVEVERLPVVCAVCSKTMLVKPTAKRAPRTPAGWKLYQALHYCPACWRTKYVLRAITMEIGSPLDCSWEELRTGLKLMWAQTTRAANRIMTELYARDTRRTGMEREKMPSMPRSYLYPELRAEFPALPSRTVSSLEHACTAKYRKLRYQIIWQASASLPTYRYPTPFPIPSQGWSARIEEDRPIVSLTIGDRTIHLRLKSGARYRRQFAQFRLIAQGRAVPGEAAVYARDKSLLVKLVAWLPRAETRELDGTLRVRTTAESLLLAVNGKDEALWTYNGDHLRRWAAEHRKALLRFSQDAKFENRPTPDFAERRAAAARKFRDRMDSATHEIAAQLAGYAQRRRFATIEYDDTERGFCQDLPWFRLASLVKEKLDGAGIVFVATGKAAVEAEQTEPPAGGEGEGDVS